MWMRNRILIVKICFIAVSIACLAGLPQESSFIDAAFSTSTGKAKAFKAKVFPIMSPRLSSGFGKRRHPIFRVVRHHSGLDLAAPKDSQIRSVAAGRVVFADTYAGYGNLVVVQHADQVTSHYGHCNKLLVEIGAVVKAGEIIATVGSTGNSTGPHLHLEIRKNGKALNPRHYIHGINKKARG